MSRITIEQVLEILNKSKMQDMKIGEKTTVMHCTLPNGFEIVESSSCVDPADYDRMMGINVCMAKLEGSVWLLEGYRLQCELSEGGAQ